jgi:hypothetical protein
MSFTALPEQHVDDDAPAGDREDRRGGRLWQRGRGAIDANPEVKLRERFDLRLIQLNGHRSFS